MRHKIIIIMPSRPSQLRFSTESVSSELSRPTRDSDSSRSGPRRVWLGRVFEPCWTAICEETSLVFLLLVDADHFPCATRIPLPCSKSLIGNLWLRTFQTKHFTLRYPAFSWSVLFSTFMPLFPFPFCHWTVGGSSLWSKHRLSLSSN